MPLISLCLFSLNTFISIMPYKLIYIYVPLNHCLFIALESIECTRNSLCVCASEYTLSWFKLESECEYKHDLLMENQNVKRFCIRYWLMSIAIKNVKVSCWVKLAVIELFDINNRLFWFSRGKRVHSNFFIVLWKR